VIDRASRARLLPASLRPDTAPRPELFPLDTPSEDTPSADTPLADKVAVHKAEGRSPGAETLVILRLKAIEFLSVQLIGAIVAVTFPSSRGSAGLNSSARALVHSVMTVKRLAGPLG